MTQYTTDDIKYLAQCIKDSTAAGSKPFALILGAGMSKSAGIPLAADIVEEINTDPNLAKHLRGLPAEQKNSYPACMAKLSIEDRRSLLDKYLNIHKVNFAHLAAAALMKGEYVKRVLTFNFDSILARACGIFGHYPATYDFSVQPPSEFSFLKEGCIIHLHGQGAGLVMLNSARETALHARKLVPLLVDTLAGYDLMVVGYSGEADSAFGELARLFSGRTRLFWVGFSAEPKPHVRKLLQKADGTSVYYGGADADTFLHELAIQFDCWPPQLFLEPEQHLLEELKPVVQKAPTIGVSLLQELRDELEERAAHRSPMVDASAAFWKGNETFHLARLRRDEELFGESFARYAEAVKIKPDMRWAFNNWGNALSGLAQIKRDEALYRESCTKYAEAVNVKPDMHEAFSNWGNALLGLARLTGDESHFRESFAKFAEAVKIKPDMHEAFNNWANALSGLAQLKDDEALYRESFAKYVEAVRIKPDMPEAFSNWGAALSGLAQLKGDEALYRESFGKFAEAVKIKPDMPEAFSNWGNALLGFARHMGDEALFRQSFAKFAEVVRIKPDAHEALDNWSGALGSLWHITGDDALLLQGVDLAAKAEGLRGRPSYNLACLLALQGNEDACRAKLRDCKAAGTLPAPSHLREDADLAAFRDRDWFADLLRE